VQTHLGFLPGPALALALLGSGGSVAESSRASSVSGIIETDETRVASQSGGRVQRILAQEGDAVQAGSPLAELDAAELGQTRPRRRSTPRV